MKSIRLLIVFIGYILIRDSSGVSLDATPEEFKKFMKDLNDGRRILAKNEKISNMHELTWNSSLQAAVISKTYDEMNSSSEWYLWWSLKKDITFKCNLPRKCVTQGPPKSINGEFPFFYPWQTTITCAERQCKVDPGIAEPCFICLLGPSQLPKDIVDGLPGTNCRDGFKNNNGGLCSAEKQKDPTVSMPEVKPDPEQASIIVNLNEKRRGLAKNQRIANMHELSWSHELQVEVDTLFFEKIKETRDYTRFEEHPMSFSLDEITGPCVNETHIKCAVFYPNQTTAACAMRKWEVNGEVPQILCIVGPGAREGVEALIKGQPGTQCRDGFKNDNDGLCSDKVPPTTEAPKVPSTVTVPSKPVDPKPTTPLPPPNPTTVAAEVVVPSEVNSTVSSNPKPTEPSEFHFTPGAPKVLTSSKAPAAPTKKPSPLITRPVPTLPAELRDYVEMDGDEYDDDFPTDSPNKTNGRSFGVFFLVLLIVVLKV